MKRNRKRIAKGTELPKVVIINRAFVSPQKTCDRCAKPSGMITPEEAAVLFNVSTRTIYRWLEAGSIHFSEMSGGMLLICLSSLASATAEGAHTPLKPEG
jgi:excisionase family DNA binding protein